ncbi:MAG: hypothetical protein IJT97_07285 [Bacteroidaceae bacterium]|nr:hypothetical protein [Bacteroidaceae bacterium]
MKKLINVLLGIAALAMLFICYRSIADQQNFDAEVKQREIDVKKRLIEIRNAENAYKEQNPDIGFCGNWDTLIAWVKEAKLPTVIKQGVLTEDQMEKGLTESKAAAIVARGNAAEIAANGLQNFRRDTTWVSLIDSLYPKSNYPDGFSADELRYIPNSDANGGEKKEFELIAVWIKTKSDAVIPVMECGAEYETFICGDSKLWSREAANKREVAEGMGNYPGLKIGEAGLNWNNNAGNWE